MQKQDGNPNTTQSFCVDINDNQLLCFTTKPKVVDQFEDDFQQGLQILGYGIKFLDEDLMTTYLKHLIELVLLKNQQNQQNDTNKSLLAQGPLGFSIDRLPSA